MWILAAVGLMLGYKDVMSASVEEWTGCMGSKT
jgi:hypothetical protein